MNPSVSNCELRLLPISRLAIVALLSASLLLSGCTTMHSVAVPTSSSQTLAVHVGDHLEVQTKAGHVQTFTVTQIEPDAFVGKDVRVKFDDISGLQVRKIQPAKTAGMVVAVAVLIGLVVVGVGLSQLVGP